MSIEIITHRHITTEYTYYRDFDRKSQPGSGFMFDCDKDGNVNVEELNPAAKSNWDKCLNDPDLIDKGVQSFPCQIKHPAIGRCECGKQVELSNFTNTCRCGRDYNMSGQLLAPRSHWGEETGESVSDILAVDNNW